MQPVRLENVKDGRAFAIALLKELERLCHSGGSGQFSDISEVLDAFDDGSRIPVRIGPQTGLIRQAFDTVYRAPEGARRGFFSVVTFAFGTAPSGWLNAETFVEDLALNAATA